MHVGRKAQEKGTCNTQKHFNVTQHLNTKFAILVDISKMIQVCRETRGQIEQLHRK